MDEWMQPLEWPLDLDLQSRPSVLRTTYSCPKSR